MLVLPNRESRLNRCAGHVVPPDLNSPELSCFYYQNALTDVTACQGFFACDSFLRIRKSAEAG